MDEQFTRKVLFLALTTRRIDTFEACWRMLRRRAYGFPGCALAYDAICADDCELPALLLR